MDRLYPQLAPQTANQPFWLTTPQQSLADAARETDAATPQKGARRPKRSLSSAHYDRFALKQKEVKVDQAPYSVGEAGERISTVDGSLHVEQTDLVLPGPNGLDFALRRVYDSSRAKDDTYYYSSSDQQLTKMSYEDQHSSLGKGWIGDMPHIKRSGDEWYIYMPKKGTFALNQEGRLYGYRFSYLDVKFRRDERGETVGYTLFDQKQDVTYSFDQDGQRVKIEDPYANTLKFVYERRAHPTSSTLRMVVASTKGMAKTNVLTLEHHENRVQAKVGYTDPVTKQGKQKVVTSIKKKLTLNGRKQSLLTAVIDPVGRRTQYYYAVAKPLLFNIVPRYNQDTDFTLRMLHWGKNEAIVLVIIEHPTKALTKFSVSPVTRKIGYHAQEKQIQYVGREVLYRTAEGRVSADKQRLYFPDDYGETPGDVTYEVRVVEDDRITTKYKYTIDHERDYVSAPPNVIYTHSPVRPPLVYHDRSETTTSGSTERKTVEYELR